MAGSSDSPGRHAPCLVPCPSGSAFKTALILPLNEQLEEGEIVQGASGSTAPSGMGFLMA